MTLTYRSALPGFNHEKSQASSLDLNHLILMLCHPPSSPKYARTIIIYGIPT